MEDKLITPQECLELDAKYGQDLYFYLTLDDEKKKIDMLNHGLWLFSYYIQNYYFSVDKTKILNDIRRRYISDRVSLFNDILNGCYKCFHDKFLEYLFGEYKSVERFGTAPSWMCYKSPKIVKNRWVLYDKDAIFKNVGNIKEKYGGKYVFGYLAYDIDNLYPIKEDEKKFILCRVNGVKAFNILNNKWEVIFWRETAKDFINIRMINDKWNVFCGECKDILFTCNTLNEISEWIKNEDNPYRDDFLDFLKDKKSRKQLE